MHHRRAWSKLADSYTIMVICGRAADFARPPRR